MESGSDPAHRKEAVMDRYRDDFDRACHRAVWGDRLARLRHRPNGLLSYHQIRRQLVVTGQSYRGIRVVPVDKIVGSTDRCHDFDTAFRPLRTNSACRWVSVARGYAEGLSLPPVQLYQIGDAYFVVDGHHRVSVARVRGQGWIDAEVVEVLTLAPFPAPHASKLSPVTGGKATNRKPLRRLAEVLAAGMVRRPRAVRTP
jgi:hypothetical protein